MNDLTTLTLADTIQALRDKKFSLSELLSSYRSVIEKHNQKLNILLTTTLDNHPEQLDSPLAGSPLVVKDNISTKNIQTTAASTVLDGYRPPFDATIIHRLYQAGASIIGKSNLDAWAHGSSTETSQYGRTLNPRNPDYLPGGSSGGSAAAVAANMCAAAIGTETAGSIRQPAAWCGVVGLKPSYGRVSRFGVIAMASSTDSPGPITKTVEDAAILLNFIAGHDHHDSTTSSQSAPDFTTNINQSIKNLRVGILYQGIKGLEIVDPHLQKVGQVLESLGAQVDSVSAMDPKLAISVYTVVQRGEVSSNLARMDGVRFGNDRSYFGDEAKRRIMLGTYTLSKGYADQYYNTAQKVRTLFIEDFKKLFKKFDVLISPTSPSFAKKVGATADAAMFGELEDMLLEPSSITGLPGINVPCYQDKKTHLFLGLNIVAPMWREDLVIKVADAYEKATSWNEWRNKA